MHFLLTYLFGGILHFNYFSIYAVHYYKQINTLSVPLRSSSMGCARSSPKLKMSFPNSAASDSLKA